MVEATTGPLCAEHQQDPRRPSFAGRLAQCSVLAAPGSCCAQPQDKWGSKQIVRLIQDKITQHTRSDADRVRKVFSLFNDGVDGGGEAGIDAVEFARGMMSFGITLTEEQATTVFGLLDKDNSGTISPRELADGLFPASTSSIAL